ncbi:MAG: hypothetical protein IJE14_08020 [Clostridia bacterium]|nr:hypothetical protein [Clostridia bacterium]
MKFKKTAVILALLLMLFCFSPRAQCAENNELYDEQLEASGANELFDVLTRDELELLETLGLDEIDFDSVFSPSLRSVTDLFWQIIRSEYRLPFESLGVAAMCVVALAAVSQFLPDGIKISKVPGFTAGIMTALSVVIPLSSCITRAVSAIALSSNFVTALIPVLAAIITAGGKPSLALTYNSLSFAAAQVVSSLGSTVIRPVIQVIMSLSIISCVSQSADISKILEFAKKTVVFVMSLSATVFVTMLSLKGMLAASADTVAVRGIRFLIGNMIPVVGGAVSDAYLSIVGTLSLVKNTVGVFALAVVAVINLPVIAECIMWVLTLNMLALLGDVFSQNGLSSLFRSVSSAAVLLCVTVVLEMLVFLLSVGLVLVIGGSA